MERNDAYRHLRPELLDLSSTCPPVCPRRRRSSLSGRSTPQRRHRGPISSGSRARGSNPAPLGSLGATPHPGGTPPRHVVIDLDLTRIAEVEEIRVHRTGGPPPELLTGLSVNARYQLGDRRRSRVEGG